MRRAVINIDDFTAFYGVKVSAPQFWIYLLQNDRQFAKVIIQYIRNDDEQLKKIN